MLILDSGIFLVYIILAISHVLSHSPSLISSGKETLVVMERYLDSILGTFYSEGQCATKESDKLRIIEAAAHLIATDILNYPQHKTSSFYPTTYSIKVSNIIKT